MRHLNRSIPSWGRRAMTLVEVLVAGGILVVVLGIALGMMTESQAASRGIARRQEALQTAERAMRLALEQIQTAVHPMEFGASSLIVPAPSFGPERASFARFEPDGRTVNLITIHQTSETTLVRTEAIPNRAIASEIPLVRPDDDSYLLATRFAYATAAEPGMPPAYQETIGVGEWPALVRVTVTATPRTGQGKPIVLQSAVIPGAISNRLNQPNAAPAATSPTVTAPAAGGVAP